MVKRHKPHVRNVAGYKLTQRTRAVYEQTLPDGKLRWFVRYKARNSNKSVWKYTEPFVQGKSPNRESTKHYPTMTDAVIAANQ